MSNDEDSHNTILKKSLGHYQIVFKDGELLVWNMPMLLETMASVVIRDSMTYNRFGKQAVDLDYYLMKSQAKVGMEFLHKKWGYKSIKKVLEYQIQTSAIMGRGQITLKRFDVSNCYGIVSVPKNVYAQTYKKFFGLQNFAVDHHLRGAMAGLFSYAFGTEVVGIETQCEVMGKPKCIIELKPKEAWDTNDPLVAQQMPGEESEFEEEISKLNVSSMQQN